MAHCKRLDLTEKPFVVLGRQLCAQEQVMKTAGAQLGPWDDLTTVDNVARGQGAAEAVALVGSSGLSRKMLSMVTDPLS